MAMLRTHGVLGLAPPVMTLAKGVVIGMFPRKLVVAGVAVLAMLLVTSRADWLAHQPPSVVAQEPPPKKVEEKPKFVKPLSSQSEAAATLRRVVDFPGLDDPKTKLVEALDFVAKFYRVTFDINEKAFKRAGQEDILAYEITNPIPIPPMRVSVRKVLMKILSRLPVDATYLIRRDGIVEITTLKAARAELGVGGWLDFGDQEPLVLAHHEFEQVPLKVALSELRDTTGANIALDPRIEEKTTVKVTARLMNVTVDNAARVLADMGGLAVIRLENVYYVTTPENASKLKKEK